MIGRHWFDGTLGPQEEEGAGFTVLEEVDKKKAVKVVRVLPNWLAKPSVISCDLGSKAVPAQDFPGLHKAVRDALRRNRIQHLFPVQQQVLQDPIFLLMLRNQ